MQIKGKVFCFYEQSGTFRDAFRERGIESYCYDIRNDYGKTDYIIDLFSETEKAFDGVSSIWDDVSENDLVIAFFPCIHFCQFALLYYRGESFFTRKSTARRKAEISIEKFNQAALFFGILKKMESIVLDRKIRLIIENPWTMSLLWLCMRKSSVIDTNRRLKGDKYKKPTAYWFYNCEPSNGTIYEKPKEISTIEYVEGKIKAHKGGICGKRESEISPEYAKNFISCYILGITKEGFPLSLF